MQTSDMSGEDEKDEILKNEDTLTRRAWVDRALEGVRRRLEGDQGLPGASEAAEPRPQLYVVPSDRKR